MRRVRFWVPGDPAALARARVGRRGHWYTPRESVDAEQQVGLAWLATGGKPFGPHIPLAIHVEAYCRRPKKPKHPFPSRPDADNVAKLVSDALERVGAYGNDSQVVGIWCWKRWVDVLHKEPGCMIYIEEVEGDVPLGWMFYIEEVEGDEP
mgnify:CR=1 FL=1